MLRGSAEVGGMGLIGNGFSNVGGTVSLSSKITIEETELSNPLNDKSLSELSNICLSPPQFGSSHKIALNPIGILIELILSFVKLLNCSNEGYSPFGK